MVKMEWKYFVPSSVQYDEIRNILSEDKVELINYPYRIATLKKSVSIRGLHPRVSKVPQTNHFIVY